MPAIKIKQVHAENIYLLYAFVKNASEVTDALMADKDFPLVVKHSTLLPIRNKLNWIKTTLDSKVPEVNRQIHEQQLKNNDTMRIAEIQRLFTRMTPDQQELFEEMGIALAAGEQIEFKGSNE